MQAPDDKPLAAAKTVLREMTKSRGLDLLKDMAELPHNSAVRQYFKMYLTRFRPEEAAALEATAGSGAGDDEDDVIRVPIQDHNAKCATLLARLSECNSGDVSVDIKAVVDELWELRVANPELEPRILEAVGACCPAVGHGRSIPCTVVVWYICDEISMLDMC